MLFIRTFLSFSLYVLLASGQVNVLTSDYDTGRTGANLAETQLTVANVIPGNFGLLGVFPVDGQIFAQPLYVSGLNIPGQGQHNVLFAATEHNTIYAYDADSTASPSLLWNLNLGPAVPSASLPSDSNTGPFIDVNPEIGILSTPAIDLEAGVMYVVADTLTTTGTLFQLHALDLATGQERMNGPVNITATVAGGGSESAGNSISFDPAQHIQRPGLLLANGAVYVAFGSHADYGAWHGWLMSYDASDLTNQLGVFQTTPGGNGGAIWQSGRGLAADDAGNVYCITGNGDYDGIQNFSESFLKVSGGALSLADWYTPANWQSLTDSDVDLSAGPAIVPGSHQLIGADKRWQRLRGQRRLDGPPGLRQLRAGDPGSRRLHLQPGAVGASRCDVRVPDGLGRFHEGIPRNGRKLRSQSCVRQRSHQRCIPCGHGDFRQRRSGRHRHSVGDDRRLLQSFRPTHPTRLRCIQPGQ